MKRPWVYMSSPSRSPLPPPSPPASSRSSQSTRSECLSHASNLGWWSVSPLTVYMFRCCSLALLRVSWHSAQRVRKEWLPGATKRWAWESLQYLPQTTAWHNNPLCVIVAQMGIGDSKDLMGLGWDSGMIIRDLHGSEMEDQMGQIHLSICQHGTSTIQERLCSHNLCST